MKTRTGYKKRGFTLIELTIVLVVAGLLFVGLWRLLAGGNQQVRDQQAANQQAQVISAVKAYLASAGAGSGQAFMSQAGYGPGAAKALPLPPTASPAGSAGCPGAATMATDSGLCSYLPAGFSVSTPNSYGQTYTVQVLRDGTAAGSPPTTYSFMIVTTGGDTISDTSGGRIASLIGNDGGFIYSTNVCNAQTGGTTAQSACGAYGTWAQNVTGYGYGAAATASGEVATRTSVSPSTDNTFPWLERNVSIPGDAAYRGWNTMTTDLLVGGSSIQAPGAHYANIYLGPIVAATNPAYTAGNTPGSIYMASPGVAAGGGSINVAGGAINMQAATGTINMAAGTMNLQNGQILGDGTSSIILTPTGGVPAIQITPSATMTTPAAVLISGVADQSKYLIDATNGCDGETDVLGNISFTPPGCSPAIYTDNIQVLHLVEATTLYATKFIYNGSDIRLKSNIRPLVSALDNVMKLNPVSFTYKTGGPQTFGVIAQDIEKVYPQLVGENKDGMKMVNYIGLIAPLIGAVQELKQENDNLRHELKLQQKRQDEIEQKMKSKATE